MRLNPSTWIFILGVWLALGVQPALALPASNVLPDRSQIISTCLLANDYWIANNGGEINPIELNRWDPSAYYTGNQRFSEVLKAVMPLEVNKKAIYLERARLWGVMHDWERGPEGRTHADAHSCGQTYIDLFRLDAQSNRLYGVDGITGIKPTMDSVLDEGLTVANDWHWIDAFYMSGTVFAKLDQTIGEVEGRDYSAALKLRFLDMRDTKDLFDDAWGLWYRDANSKLATTENGFPEFWGRGNGWVIGALVRVMDELGPGHEDWNIYADMLQTMAAALVPFQQADGFWRSSLADPLDSRWDNPETSCTAFITYAMAWGINNGMLDAATYEPVVAKAWNGMVQTALHSDGFLGYVQDAARMPEPAYYNHTEDYGVGAFLLAGSELSLMAHPPPIWMSLQVEADSVSVHASNLTLYATNTLQYTSDLTSDSWHHLATMTGLKEAILVDSASTQRFYRIWMEW